MHEHIFTNANAFGKINVGSGELGCTTVNWNQRITRLPLRTEVAFSDL